MHVCGWVCLYALSIQGDCSDHQIYAVSSVPNSNNLRQGLLPTEHCKVLKSDICHQLLTTIQTRALFIIRLFDLI